MYTPKDKDKRCQQLLGRLNNWNWPVRANEAAVGIGFLRRSGKRWHRGHRDTKNPSFFLPLTLVGDRKFTLCRDRPVTPRFQVTRPSALGRKAHTEFRAIECESPAWALGPQRRFSTLI